LADSSSEHAHFLQASLGLHRQTIARVSGQANRAEPILAQAEIAAVNRDRSQSYLIWLTMVVCVTAPDDREEMPPPPSRLANRLGILLCLAKLGGGQLGGEAKEVIILGVRRRQTYIPFQEHGCHYVQRPLLEGKGRQTR
jgi:hypothetical protein